MLDELREDAEGAPPFEGDDALFDDFEELEEKKRLFRPPKGLKLNLTPAQRLLLSVMFFLLTCIMSLFFLVITGRLYL